MKRKIKIFNTIAIILLVIQIFSYLGTRSSPSDQPANLRWTNKSGQLSCLNLSNNDCKEQQKGVQEV
jgi:hypothetical protein